MSHRVLNPEQFFHASPHKMEPGTVLTPGGRSPNFQTDEPSHVYMAGSPHEAEGWGKLMAQENLGLRHVHVYEVHPHGEVERDTAFVNPVDEEGEHPDWWEQSKAKSATVRKHLHTISTFGPNFGERV